jgi:transposase-like protein
MGMNALPKTLLQAVKYFANPDNCREYLVARRWPNGVTCPTCGSKTVYFDRSRNGWECKTRHPKRKFTLKTGTIFEDSPLGLDKWLPTVWMIANCKNGVSSWEIHRAIGVTQKTAWFMLHRIRLAMQDEDTGGKLGGTVEADETYIGGKARFMHNKRRKALNQHGRSAAGKTVVMGLLERHGDDGHSKVRTHVLTNIKRGHVQQSVRAHVEAGSTLYTDALSSYTGLDTEYMHYVIDHAEKYVDGQIHTNGCENFWSLLKRALKGTYVAVEPFHLFRYLDEQVFRFNHRREMDDADRFSEVVRNIVGRRLTYKELIAAINDGAAMA